MQGRDGLAGGKLKLLKIDRNLVIFTLASLQAIPEIMENFHQRPLADPGLGRCQQTEHDACQGRMQPSVMKCQPDRDSDREIRKQGPNANPIHQVDQREPGNRPSEPNPIQGIGKEGGDDHHGDQVIDNRQRQEKDFQAKRDAATK